MPAFGKDQDPDPRDPRVQDEIRDAVRRARGSAFGSYMSEQDLAKAAGAHLSNVYGSDAGLSAEIRREVARQWQPGEDPAAPAVLGIELPGQESGPGFGPGFNPPASLNDQAMALATAGRLAEAIPLFEMAVAERERDLGHQHQDTLRTKSNLAGAYREVGRLRDAISLYQQTVAVQGWIMGMDHPDTLVTRDNFALTCSQAGMLADAIHQYELTLDGRDRILGSDDLDTIGTRNRLAGEYRKAGRSAEAVMLLKQARAACRRVLGDEHPFTVIVRKNLKRAKREVKSGQ